MDIDINLLNQKLKKILQKIPLKKLSIYLLAILFVLFLVITGIIVFYSPAEFEAEFTRELQEDRSPMLDAYMKFVSWFGENQVAIPMIVGVFILFSLFGYIKEGIFMLLTSLASVLNFGLKLLINRQRPTDDLVEILTETSNQSFPSGHTVHYVVFFGMFLVLFFRIRQIKVIIRVLISLLCLTLIISVPFSRVYLGAHWTSDVTAGIIIGLLVLALLLFFYFKKSSFLDRLNRKGFLLK